MSELPCSLDPIGILKAQGEAPRKLVLLPRHRNLAQSTGMHAREMKAVEQPRILHDDVSFHPRCRQCFHGVHTVTEGASREYKEGK